MSDVIVVLSTVIEFLLISVIIIPPIIILVENRHKIKKRLSNVLNRIGDATKPATSIRKEINRELSEIKRLERQKEELEELNRLIKRKEILLKEVSDGMGGSD